MTDKWMENLKQASEETQAHVRPPNFFNTILCFVALVYHLYFFQNSRSTAIIRH